MIAPREDDVQARFFDFGLTRRLLQYVRPYIGYVVFSLCVFVVMAVLLNTLPVLIKNAIDRFLAAGSDALPAAERMEGLFQVGALYLGLASIGYVVRFAQGFLMAWVGQRIISDIRKDVFAKVLRMPSRFFDQTPVGRLMTRVTSDVEAMQRMVTDGVVGLTADLFMLLVTTGFMIYVSPRLAGTLFLILPVLFGLLTFVNYRLRGAHRQVRKIQAALNAFVQEALTGMTTIQLFNRERASHRVFAQHNLQLRDSFNESVRWFSVYFPLLDLLRSIATVLILLVGCFTVFSGSDAITVGTLVAFLSYIRSFFQPLEDLSDKSSMFQQAMASSERIFQLMDTEEDIRDPDDPRPLDTFAGRIRFDGVWFAYNDEDWVFKDLNLSIDPGESVALVGATGAGKTSIISLISRFYDVQKGSVEVDGINVRDLRQRDLRRCMGIVLQDPFIFSGTIAENISLGNPEVTPERIREAAAYVNADRFVSRLPNGYETELSERGTSLSTGQKQLLALARALVQNPDILLILDEATASVDTETENMIQEALQRVMQDRTSIIIAHRLSTIRNVDRILVMRHGAVLESGSHADLIRKGGYYKRLFELMSHDAET